MVYKERKLRMYTASRHRAYSLSCPRVDSFFMALRGRFSLPLPLLLFLLASLLPEVLFERFLVVLAGTEDALPLPCDLVQEWDWDIE